MKHLGKMDGWMELWVGMIWILYGSSCLCVLVLFFGALLKDNSCNKQEILWEKTPQFENVGRWNQD